MKRRRKPLSRSKSSPAAAPRAKAADATPELKAAVDDPQESDEVTGPGSRLRSVLSVWLVFHVLALAISYSSVVEPSETQVGLLEVLQVYLTPTHFSAGGVPLYLARGDQSEQPHRLQISEVKPTDDPELFDAPIDDQRWQTVPPAGPAGMAASDRYHRWLSTAALMAGNEQPSLVAELILPSVASRPAAEAVRIVRLPTQLTTTADDAQPPPYSAYVARKGETVSLVQVNEPRLSTQPRGEPDE